MRRTKRIIIALLIMVFLVNHVSVSALAASKKDKKAVKARVVTLMKNVRKYNESGIKNCFQPRKYRKGFILFNQNSKYASTLRQVHKKYLDYEIGRIKIKGNKANVKVYVTYYDLYDVFQSAFWDMVEYEMDHPGAIESKGMEKAQYDFMKKAIKRSGSYPLTDITCYIPLVKRNGKWKIEKMTKNMDFFIGCRYRQSVADLDY